MARSDIDHYDGLTWWGPVSDASMDAVLGLVDLPDGSSVVDIGCGRAELLVRLAERSRVRAVGIDRSAAALALVRAELESRVPQSEVTLLEIGVEGYEPETRPVSMVSFLGGPYIGGSYASTVATIHRWMASGGLFLAGHGFWMKDPPAEYLEATGIDASEFTSHEGNIATGTDAGFELLHESVSTQEEWSAFEGRILENRERWFATHPDDEEASAALGRSRSWNEARQRWGRHTMGFALYLFRKR